MTTMAFVRVPPGSKTKMMSQSRKEVKLLKLLIWKWRRTAGYTSTSRDPPGSKQMWWSLLSLVKRHTTNVFLFNGRSEALMELETKLFGVLVAIDGQCGGDKIVEA
jgi:hypothetical protein